MTRRAEPRWIDKMQHWRIDVQRVGERKSFYSKTPGAKGKREVERLADKWLTSGMSEDPRFKEVWEAYLKRVKDTTGTENYKKHEQMGRLWLLPQLEFKRISSVTPIMFQACIDEASKKDKSKKTCENIKASIVAVCKFARMSKLPLEKPEELIIPKNARVGKRRILDDDALKILLTEDTIMLRNKIVPAFYINCWRLLVTTGFRRGEMCGLKWEDIKGNIIDMKRSINDKNEITSGKNNNALRRMELPQLAVGVLVDQAEILKKHGITSEWVFPNPKGDQVRPNAPYKHWVKFCELHGMKCSLHELRHTFISLFKNEMPEWLLKRLVGHSASMDTHSVYGHEMKNDLKRIAEIIDQEYKKIMDVENETR